MRTFKLKKCKCVGRLHFSPDGRRLMAIGGPTFAVGVAVTLDVASGQEVGRVEKGGFRAVVSPDFSRYTVARSGYGSEPPFVSTPLPVPDDGRWSAIPTPERMIDVFGLATDRTGEVLALGYHREPRQAHVQFETAVDVVGPNSERIARFTVWGLPWVIAFDHDGKRLAVTSGAAGAAGVEVFALPSGERVIEYAPPGTRTTALQFLPDGRLAAANSRSVYVYPPDGDAPQFALGGHGKQINALAASPDGRRLLSASNDGAVRVWDADSGDEVRVFEWQIGAITAVAVAPDGLTCAAAGKNGQLVLWDADG